MVKIITMWIQLVSYLIWMSMDFAGGSRKGCGGTLTASRGILTTPNFPGPFSVPLNCEWVIDAQHVWAPNTSIIVYLTQLFVFEGLTFTEYQLYGSDYKINPQIIHRVNETNISRVRWVQTFQSFLVIRLKLITADSAHLRVLDNFLDVYGFNITYEISTEAVRANSCTMMDCGFTGNCYDYYSSFSCKCLPGYYGPYCSDGPKSLCDASGLPTCRNGGTCIHVGVASVKCLCTSNFTGSTCEKPISDTSLTGCTACRTTCPFDGRIEKTCRCLDKHKVNTSNAFSGGRMGFTTTMHLSNLPILEDDELKKYIEKQILRNLQMNSSRVEDVAIKTIVHFRSGADVTFHVYSSKKEERRLRSILNKWADRGYVGNITISEKDTTLRSLLSLESLAINQEGIIRENDEFILSCVARGSPTMSFRWFKDGIPINVTSTSRKWMKLIKDPHVADQYTALLAIESAHIYDEGLFTCQIEDFNIQQCLSREVEVGKRPTVNIEPMTITVRKGGNFTVKCVTVDENGSKFTYSWTKNKELLPVRTENEKYEILYPTGTILQVFNAEKDVQYSCLVQGEVSSSERVVTVHVVDRKGVYTCPGETFLQILWPETAPDTNSVLSCPKGYRGIATRYCVLRDGLRPAWSLPSFSECTHAELQEIHDAFVGLKLGYLTTMPQNILKGYLDYFNRTSSRKLLPGEGARLLTLAQEVMLFISKREMSMEEAHNISYSLLSIMNGLLLSPHSLTKQSEVRLLIELISEHLSTLSTKLVSRRESFEYHASFDVIDITILNISHSEGKGYFHIPDVYKQPTGYYDWSSVQLSGTNAVDNLIGNSRLVAGIIFKNLSSFLPPRSFIRLKDGSELEYEIYSQIVSIFPMPKFLDIYPIAIDFKHELNNNMNWSNDETWSVKCGYADLSTFTYTWDIHSCYTETLSDSKTRCICPRSGIFALLLTLAPKIGKSSLRYVTDKTNFIQDNGLVNAVTYWGKLINLPFYICTDFLGFRYFFIFRLWKVKYQKACQELKDIRIVRDLNELELSSVPIHDKSDSRHYILVTGCCLGMILALFTTACLATSCFLMKKSCLMALKLQCSMSIFATGLMFMLATITGPPQTYFLLFITTIETFVLLGMSSHLSKLLIVFTDLIEVPKPMTSKYTVIGIISGVPVITVFGSHLSYKTLDIQLESWWMLKGTLSFNIFVGVASMMSVLFVFLYIIVMKKLQELIGIHEKYTKSIRKRVALLRRSGCIFSAVTLFSVSSLIYINYPNKLWSVYQFSVYNVFLGLVLLFCYVIKAETQFQKMFDYKSQPNTDNKFFTSDSMSKPLNFITQQEPEVENECNPHLRTELHQFTTLGRDASKSVMVSKSQSIAATFESCLNTTTSFCDSQVDISSTSASTPQSSVELFNNSAHNCRKPTSSTIVCSPDILSNKKCVELDLVASSLRSSNKIHVVSSMQAARSNAIISQAAATPDEAIATILQTEILTFRPVHQYHVRTQPDGHDGCILAETTLETVEEVNEIELDAPVCTVGAQPLVSVQTPVSVQPSVSVHSSASAEPSVSALPSISSQPSTGCMGSSVSDDQPVNSACSDKLDGMLDSISQDLEYLLNRTDVVPSSSLKRLPKSPKHNISQDMLDELADLPESVTLRTSC